MAYDFPNSPVNGDQTPDGKWEYVSPPGVWEPVAEDDNQVLGSLLTLYVDPNGSDANDGSIVTTPYRTIQTAVSAVPTGGIVRINRGTYTGPFDPSQYNIGIVGNDEMGSGQHPLFSGDITSTAVGLKLCGIRGDGAHVFSSGAALGNHYNFVGFEGTGGSVTLNGDGFQEFHNCKLSVPLAVNLTGVACYIYTSEVSAVNFNSGSFLLLKNCVVGGNVEATTAGTFIALNDIIGAGTNTLTIGAGVIYTLKNVTGFASVSIDPSAISYTDYLVGQGATGDAAESIAASTFDRLVVQQANTDNNGSTVLTLDSVTRALTLADLGMPTAIQLSGVDLSSKRLSQIFVCDATCTNGPGAFPGTLDVIGDSTRASQTFTADDGRKWTRSYVSGAWRSWTPVLVSIGSTKNFYYAPTGSDTTGDGSSGNPWLSGDGFKAYSSTVHFTDPLLIVHNFAAGSYDWSGLSSTHYVYLVGRHKVTGGGTATFNLGTLSAKIEKELRYDSGTFEFIGDNTTVAVHSSEGEAKVTILSSASLIVRGTASTGASGYTLSILPGSRWTVLGPITVTRAASTGGCLFIRGAYLTIGHQTIASVTISTSGGAREMEVLTSYLFGLNGAFYEINGGYAEVSSNSFFYGANFTSSVAGASLSATRGGYVYAETIDTNIVTSPAINTESADGSWISTL